MSAERDGRWRAALAAGGIAILLNTAALAAADLVPLATAHGGLLKLLVVLAGGRIRPPAGPFFPLGFHVAVGLLMAIFYAYVLERRLPGPPWMRGLVYALLVWLANSAVVLPMLGEGFAGRRGLGLAGMAWFAAAHTLFFVLTAVLYAAFARPRGGRSSAAQPAAAPDPSRPTPTPPRRDRPRRA